MNRRIVIIGAGVAVVGIAALIRPLLPPAHAGAATVSEPAAFSVAALPQAPVSTTDAAAEPNVRAAPVVYVVGSVRRPGVYTLAPGARLDAAVRAAGGLAAGADALSIDLAAPARDGAEVVVPHAGDLDRARRERALAFAEAAATASPDGVPAQSAGENVAESGGESVDGAPPKRHRRHSRHRRKHKRHHRVARDATLAGDAAPSDASASGDSATAASGAAGDTGSDRSKIDINTADADTLATLPGIGDALAERIVLFRTTSGPFVRPEELLDVNGMTDSRYAEIVDSITTAPAGR